MSRRTAALGRWLLRWLFLAALWLALTDTHKEPELIAGAVAAAIGATMAGRVVRPGPPRTPSKALAALGIGPCLLIRPLWRLIVDTALLAGALWRQIVLRRPATGSFRAVRYAPGQSRRSAAGRTLTEVWGSLVPNRYVVGIDEEESTLLVHELVRSDEPLDPFGDR